MDSGIIVQLRSSIRPAQTGYHRRKSVVVLYADHNSTYQML